jgi:hypothetical protein
LVSAGIAMSRTVRSPLGAAGGAGSVKGGSSRNESEATQCRRRARRAQAAMARGPQGRPFQGII